MTTQAQAKGLREQLKNPPSEFPPEPLSIETLKSYLADIMKGRKLNTYQWTHYEWGENGNLYSSWCLGGLCTGDGGYEMYLEQFKNKINDEI